MTEKQARDRAAARRARQGYGVGAAAWRNITRPGQDGLGVRLVVTDGARFARVDAGIPRATSIESDRVEDAVEQRAGLYANDEQLDRLASSVLSFPELVLEVDEDCP